MKELKRSRTNRMISGVCGGIADYFEIDPTVVRLAWVIITALTNGIGILAYLIAVLVVPEEAPPTTGTPPSGTETVIDVEQGR